jgi:hypothetical protein
MYVRVFKQQCELKSLLDHIAVTVTSYHFTTTMILGNIFLCFSNLSLPC